MIKLSALSVTFLMSRVNPVAKNLKVNKPKVVPAKKGRNSPYNRRLMKRKLAKLLEDK